MNSIRQRLLLWLLLALTVAGALAAVFTYRTAHEEANQLFDYHLKQIALTLKDQPFEDRDILGTLEEESDYDFVIQVWDASRVKLYSSHAQASLPQQAKPGFATVQHADGAWRVLLLSEDELNIQVAQPMAVRQKRAARLALRTVMPFLVMLPLMGLLIWITVSKGLSPLDALAQELKQRDHTALAAFPDRKLPLELKPMVSELNDLLVRLGHALEAQRAFTADAAHELRTPLTALQLQVQLAERAQNPEDRRDAFEQLKAGLKRSIHLVTQLLTLARNEPGVSVRNHRLVDLSLLAREVVIEQSALAQEKAIDLGIARDDNISIDGDAEGLRAMIGNLVHNALRYTPRGGRVDLSLTSNEKGPIIELSDTGLGIPPEERERVFDRFYRRESAPNTGGEVGSGIGLAIVKNVAQRHRAVVTLHDGANGQGLLVRVQFPKD